MNSTRLFSIDLLQQVDEPVVVFRYDQITYVNDSAVALFGYANSDNMIGLTVSDITSPYEKKQSYTITSEVFLKDQVDETRRFQWVHRRADRTDFYSEVIAINMSELGDHYYCVLINDLSEWSQYRDILQENVGSIESLFRYMDKIMLVINPENGQIVEANKAASSFYGFTCDELKTMSIKDINTLSGQEVQEEMDKAKREQRRHFNFKHRLKDDTISDVKVTSGPLKYFEETHLYSIIEPESYMEVISGDYDVQYREVVKQKDYYQNIFSALPFPGVMLSPDMRVLSLNQEFVNEFGYLADEAVNRHIATLITPWEHIEETEFYQKLVLQGHVIHQEGKRRHKNGSVKSYIIHGKPEYVDGEVAYVAAYYLDIDEYKKTHFKLHMIEKVFSNIDEGMLVTEPDCTISWVNKAFCEMSGYTFNELIGATPDLLSSGHHDEVFYKNMWHDLTMTGSWEGELWDKKKNGDTYIIWMTIVAVFDEMGGVSNYIGVANNITKFKAQEEKIRRLAETDSLTGLLNRATFLDETARELAVSKDAHMMVYLDLDDFKKINDTYGHDQGDLLLKVIAYRLKSSLKSQDIIGRIGGDEFVILLKDITYEQVDRVMQRLFNIISQPIQLDHQEVIMRASAGVASFPMDSGHIRELLKYADIALYKAKESKGNRCEYYSEEYEALFHRNARMEKNIQMAVEHDELRMEYQGIVKAESGSTVMAEALCRWDSTYHGLVGPDVFIPIAERNGSIVPIGYWILDRVLGDMAQWRRQGMEVDRVSINLSAIQLEDDCFVKKLKRLMKKHQIDPTQVELEITENILIEDTDGIIKVLDELQQMGISIAMDDFGTGYASLSMIHKLNLSKIKIDKSVVSDLECREKSQDLTLAILALAKKLGYRVVAEGVENSAQYKWLCDSGCDLIQGYLFHKPLPSDQFIAHVIAERREAYESGQVEKE